MKSIEGTENRAKLKESENQRDPEIAFALGAFSIPDKLELWVLTAFWGKRGRNQSLGAPKLESLTGGSLYTELDLQRVTTQD